MAFREIFLTGYCGQSQAGKMAPSCPLGQPITACGLGHLACSRNQPYNKCGFLTKCEVKMAKYWPSSFFTCLWTVTKSRSINSQKRMRPISSHLDRTNLVNKGFIMWLSGKFFLWDTVGSPEQAIWFILPAHGASHVITVYIIVLFCMFEVTSIF